MKKKILILDTFALIFRAYYALFRKPLRTSQGKPSSAIFGFVRMLMKALDDIQPDYLVLALESKASTFRQKLYSEYKSNREETPEDLKLQIPKTIELIQKFHLALLQKEEFEADDIIGTVCERYKSDSSLEIYVLTGDKDLLQLIEGNVRVLMIQEGELVEYDREKVKEKWKVYPKQMIDLLALMGDSSDNVPGVLGVGIKTAQNLIHQFESLEKLYQDLDRVPSNRIRSLLLEGRESAFLSQKLIQIERNIDLKMNLQDFQNTDLNQAGAIEFLKEYEFHSILKDPRFHKKIENGTGKKEQKEQKKTIAKQVIQKEVFSETEILNSVSSNLSPILFSNFSPKSVRYKLIVSKSDFSALMKYLKSVRLLSIDLESTSTNPLQAEIIGIALSPKPEEGYFIPILPSQEFQEKSNSEDLLLDLSKGTSWNEALIDRDLTNQEIVEGVRNICEDRSIAKLGQNIKYDLLLLQRNWEIDIEPIVFDTMLASYLLDPRRRSHGLDFLAGEFLNYKTIRYSELVGKKETLLDQDLEKVFHYACEDADITFRLYEKFKPMMDDAAFSDLYYNIEVPLLKVLAGMELFGVKISKEHFHKMSLDLEQKLKDLEKEIWSSSGERFNLNSPKQVSEILFTKLGLKPKRKIKTGFSTDISVLEELSGENQVAHSLLEYRKLMKLKSAYLDSIPKLIDAKTKRVHTSFNQTITQTGRLSSNQPNLQNIPIKEELGRSIRSGFIANEGVGSKSEKLILSADYSQIELRILAHMSQDFQLIEAYQQDKDIHSRTASLIFSVPESEVNEDQRRVAKTINFSVIYGVGPHALSQALHISFERAKNFIRQYFEQYSKVREYMEQQKKQAREKGFVETLFHRIRYIPEIHSANQRERSMGERIAINTPIQGTSADIIKRAMVNLFKAIHEEKLRSHMMIQVHDELVFEVEDSELERLKRLVREKMESAVELSVPLKVSIGYGKNWEQAH